MSPSKLFGLLWGQFAPFMNWLVVITGTNGYVSPALGGFLLWIALIILLTIMISVFVIMLIIIESYFVMFAGIILAGFAGSNWTMDYWQKYLSYVGAVAIRLFCTSLLLGLMTTELTSLEWPNISIDMTSTGATSIITNTSVIISSLIKMLGVFGFNMLLLLLVPFKAAKMLNGSIKVNLGDVIHYK